MFTSIITGVCALVEFCRVNTGVKLVWIPGVRFDTGV
jgi:hypothetical protein